MKQLSLIDLFPQQMGVTDYDIQTLPEDDMIRIVSEQTGLTFKETPNVIEDNPYKWFESKRKKIRVEVHYSHYFEDNKRFIGVGIDCGNEGSGCPCDSIEEAVGRIRRGLERYERTNINV